MTVEVSTPKSFIRYLRRLKNRQKQNAAIEAIARFINSPRDPKLNFERVVGRPGYFSIRVDYETRILLRSTEADRKYDAVAVGNHDLVYESYFRS